MTKVDLLKYGVQLGKMGMKRDIVLLAGEKGLEDLDHTTDVRLFGIHGLKGLPKRVTSGGREVINFTRSRVK